MFRLTLREPSPIPIDLTGVLPETIQSGTRSDISKMRIHHGNRLVALDSLFLVSASEATVEPQLHIEGDCSSVHNIGKGMTAGHLTVRGPVGRHLGAGLRGGTITAESSAGDWLGAEMAGGEIIVYGNAGSQVGAAYRGSRRGMAGGHIHIHGDAGDEVGLLMRRGVIRVDGTVGTFAGASMIAGTIAVGGRLGDFAGAGMKRGTIIAMNAMGQPAPGLRYACDFEPSTILLPSLALQGGVEGGWRQGPLKNPPPAPPCKAREGRENQNANASVKVQCYRGDVMTGGRGELWQVVR